MEHQRILTFPVPDCPICQKPVEKWESHKIQNSNGEEIGLELVAYCHGETCSQKVMEQEYNDVWTDFAFTDPRMHTLNGKMLNGNSFKRYRDRENY